MNSLLGKTSGSHLRPDIASCKLYPLGLLPQIPSIVKGVGYNVPFLSFVLSLSSHIVGFIKEVSSQLSFSASYKWQFATWQIASAAVINGVGNADLSCVYKGPVVPLQSLHTIVAIDESVPKNRPSELQNATVNSV